MGGKMFKKILTALSVIATIIIAQAQAYDSDEENVSLSELASLMKENFRELFTRLDRLESKVNGIIAKENNCQLGKPIVPGEGRELQKKDSPDGFNKSQIFVVTSDSGVTSAGAVTTYSLGTAEVNKIVNSNETLLAIAHDSIHDKLYWSDHDGRIFRGNRNGTEVATVLDSYQYGNFWGLAFDWIGGNLYGSTYDGYILACSATTAPTINCFTVLDGQAGAMGIALDPPQGTMYWTRFMAGSLHKAGMDGSGTTTIQTGLDLPRGLTIDFAARRLYWTERITHRIQTCDMDGGDLRTAVQLPLGSGPHGIAISGDRIYWGNEGDNKLQSSTKDGQDIQTLYVATDDIKKVILVPAGNQATNRSNDCEGRNCSTLCVLTPVSYRCLG